MESTGKWCEVPLVNVEFCTKVNDENILLSKVAVVLVMRVGMHGEDNFPQVSIVKRKPKDENNLWSRGLVTRTTYG